MKPSASIITKNDIMNVIAVDVASISHGNIPLTNI